MYIYIYTISVLPANAIDLFSVCLLVLGEVGYCCWVLALPYIIESSTARD